MRTPVAAFRHALSRSQTLRLLTRFVESLNIQTNYTAVVNARVKLEERLARWILICDDGSIPFYRQVDQRVVHSVRNEVPPLVQYV
jgi:hypothetical protein